MKKHALLLAAALLFNCPVFAATQVDIPGPPGSGLFGSAVTFLPNGNFVVTDSSFDQVSPPLANVGAVYLYNPDGLLISRLTGANANDSVGDGGVFVLANGNFVVSSTSCRNGAITGAGAATWGSAVTGFRDGPNTVVSVSNSIMGGTINDRVGESAQFFGGPVSADRPGIVVLTNGNYLVCSKSWDNPSPAATNAGAVTWADGSVGGIGLVSAANSLVGSAANDGVGESVTVLANGNYVIGSSDWNNGGTADVGAATWGSGTSGVAGVISSANSLIGSNVNDSVAGAGITALPNGNFVVLSQGWRNGAAVSAGAVTWGSGTQGITGVVSEANSLVGSSTNDVISLNLSASSFGIVVLANSNYLILSPEWDNGALVDAGAVTWGDGTKGVAGVVSEANSLVGSTANQNVGDRDPTALTNGNYVVISEVFGGAATWADGRVGIRGNVTLANSLVGSLSGSVPGPARATALANGHYVVQSELWNNGGPTAIGAATWCDGTKGTRGVVTPANSLIGSTAQDQVGNRVVALTNGNYIVGSTSWDDGAKTNVGAVTWANGKTGIKGVVSPANSLIGSTANDFVGNVLTALTNGNYVVGSSQWDNGPTVGAGAATWGDGAKGIRGVVSPANSLVGTSSLDGVGFLISPLPNGNYLVRSEDWNNGPISKVGAVTWGNGMTGITGPVSAANSLVGNSANDEVGFRVTVTASSHYLLSNQDWDATHPAAVNVGAISLGDGETGTTGQVGTANSVFGTVASRGFTLRFSHDPVRNQMIVGRRDSNLVTLFRGDRLRSLAKTNFDAPGAADIAFAKPGTAAINPLGAVLADSTLIGSGAAKGRNRALFASDPAGSTDLVLQTGTPLGTLGSGLPANAEATALLGQVFNRSNFGLFQATVKGTGITATNNRLLLLDNGASVQLLQRSGQPIGSGPLTSARVKTYHEVLQHHTANLITLRYTLATGGAVNTGNDSGLLLLDSSGSVLNNFVAREGETVFGNDGTFGPITSSAAALSSAIHFTATFKPATGKPLPAIFTMSFDGTTRVRPAQAGNPAPQSGGAEFKSFTGLTQFGPDPVVRATLANSPKNESEGLFLPSLNFLFMRTGQEVDPVNLSGVRIARIVRFWPSPGNPILSTPDHIITQVQLIGPGVTAANNQALILSDLFLATPHQILLRTGFPAPGVGPATLKTFSAIDVNPISGAYAVLGTLNGASASSNQALWTGNPKLGNNTTLRDLRLPQLTLRKGNLYTTNATPQSMIRSIALKPAIDPTGAGGRGLAQALGAGDDLALFITGDRNLVETVLLDR